MSIADASHVHLRQSDDVFQEQGAGQYDLQSPGFSFRQDSEPFGSFCDDDGANFISKGAFEDDTLEDIGFFGETESKSAQQALNELGLIPSSPLRAHQRNTLEEEEDEDDGTNLYDGPRESRTDSISPLRVLGIHTSGNEGNDDGDAFDLDRELEAEDAYIREEQEQDCTAEGAAQESIEIESDDVLEEEPSAFSGIRIRETEHEERPAIDVEIGPSLLPENVTTNIVQADGQTSLSRLEAFLHPSQSKAAGSSSSSCAAVVLPSPASDPMDDVEIVGASRATFTDNADIGMHGIPRYISVGTASAVLLDGSIARFERRKQLRSWKPKPAHYGAGATGLLSRPVHQIVDRVEAMAAERVADDADRRARPQRPRAKSQVQMWQERYRPTRFTELVGEERTHRDVLGWIKDWDACVFGRRADKKRMRERFEQQQQAAATAGFFSKPFAQDKYMRPRERVLLLGGPAGMGKTTLAHVAAKACGYNVHELNASDDRSARTVEDRVRDALETKSLQSARPTCLILDEVDGATGGGNDAGSGGGGFVKALIKLIEGGSKSEGGSGQAGAKRKKSRPLLRPIICVCNDPYAAPLRALRPYAKMVRLNRPSTPALLTRLRQICERESIPADTAGLNMLIEMCQGDVRSCLNALQLLQADSRGVNVATLRGTTDKGKGGSIASALSAKDGNSSINQVWMKLFRSQTSRERDRQRGPLAKGPRGGDVEDAEMGHDVVSSIINSGEMDKILAGCFEHYPNLKLVDDGWWRFKKAHDWMYWFEHLNQRGWELGNHTEMWGYLPWSFVCWRLYFANTANELPDYPRTDYQQHVKRTAFDEVSLEVLSGLPAGTRSQFDSLSLVTELGPLLTPILTPDLKPINSQLIRAEEKATLASVVSVMDHTNITFTLDKNEHGHSYYRFDPPLEVFSHFEGKRVLDSAAPVARFNVRQMLAGEVRAKRLREKQLASGAKAAAGSVQTDARQQTRTKKDDDDTPLQPKQAPKAKVAVDFFGRPIVPKAEAAAPKFTPSALPAGILERRRDKENQAPPFIKQSKADEVSDVQKDEFTTTDVTASDADIPPAKRAKIKVFYHFHEGYSNAVRKPIKVSALLS